MDKKKMTKNRAIANNIFALKLITGLCKRRVVHTAVVRFLGYFEWIFYSAFFMRYVIEAMQNGKSFREIVIFLVITIAVFGSVSLYNNYLNGEVIPVSDTVIFKKLYSILYKKAGNNELKCFEDSEFYNRYTLALDGAAEKSCQTIDNIFGILWGGIAAVVAFFIMFEIDHYAILFVVFPILGNFVFGSQLNKIEYNRDKDMAPYRRRIDYVNRVVHLSDFAKEVRLTDVFKLMKDKYDESIQGIIKVTDKYTVRGMVFHWLKVNFTFTFIFEGVLMYGAYRTIVSKTMSLSQLAVLSSIMVSTTWILIGFTDSLVSSYKNGLFIENLRAFLEYQSEIPEDYDGMDPGDEIHSIEFQDVSFSYKENKPILDHLSFKIEGNHSYALVGHNGAGKSTIIKLLFRLYDPVEGEILLNGRNIKEYNLKAYRRLFSAAFQDFKIFAATIRENVLMKKAVVHNEEEDAVVIDALKKAGIYVHVMNLPNGLDTILTREFDEEGVVLSGGQQQKVVVARAFAKNAPVKVFDEPSSALDPIAESELFDNILSEARNKTMIFISHRLSSVKNADKVFMLEEGHILEEGSHEELMMNHSSYADMFQKQAKNYLSTEELGEDVAYE